MPYPSEGGALGVSMLKLFYVFHYIVGGVSIPFFPAYLRKLGLSGSQVSFLLAIPPTLQLGIPLVWGWLADRTRRPDRILQVLCLGACLASLPVIVVRSMPALLGVYLAQQFFAVSISALADSLAVERVRHGAHYGPIRASGSASFIVVCLVVGVWLDHRGVTGGDALVPILVSLGLGLSFLAALTLKGHGSGERPHLREVRQLVRDSRFRLLLLLAGLHWAALVPYHGFLGILIQDRGFPAKVTSYAFFVGVAAEIVVFLAFSRLRARFALHHLLAACFAASVLRWLLTSTTHSGVLIVALQLGHALTFGAFWAASMAWIAECVPQKLRATGQVIFITVIGTGSSIGHLLAGALYDATSGAGAAFGLAGLLDLLPLALVLLLGRRYAPKASQAPEIS